MDRNEVIKVLYDKVGDSPIIISTGYACRDAYALNDRKGNFYMVGSMGHAASIAAGIALNTKLNVVVVDGDGSLLMNPSSMLLTGSLGIKRFLHVVIDNGVYESTGGQVTISEKIDFVAIAEASGYKLCQDIASVDELGLAVDHALHAKCGPSFIRVRVSELNAEIAPMIGVSLIELQKRFKTYIETHTVMGAPEYGIGRAQPCHTRVGS